MSTNITKEELDAFTKANTDVALELSKIAQSSKETSENLEKIVARLYNGMPKEIAAEINKEFSNYCAPCQEKLKKIDGNTTWLKVILGSATLIALIASVLLGVMTSIEQLKRHAQDTQGIQGVQGVNK